MNKIDDLSVFMYENDPDVVFITESWTSSDTLDSQLCMTGYELYRFDRRYRKGGGCIIYAKNDLNVVQLDIDILDTESIWCKIVDREEEVIIGVNYNSPSSNDTCRNNLNNIVKNICSTYKNVIVCGDFNYPCINWNLLHASTTSGQMFLDAILDSYLVQVIDKPTRGDNILDLILTSNEALVENINIEEPFASSDHCVVKFDITCNIIRKDWKLCYYDYRHGNYEAMKVYLAEMDWNIFINCKDVIEVWSRFIKMMKDLVVKFVPKKMRETVKKPMWWNKHIQNLGRKKTRSWDRYKLDKTEGNYTSYKNALNKNTDAIRQAKRRLEKKIAKNIKSDPKMFFKYAGSKTRSRTRIGPLVDDKGNVVDNDNVTAEMFNAYFASVFTKEREAVPDAVNMCNNDQEGLKNLDLSPQKVMEVLTRLNPNKTPGVDQIYSVMLKNLANELAIPLSHIFKCSMATGIVPEDWRIANVAVIHKRGPKKECGNYRPVSLTSQVSKVFETLVRDAILDHLYSKKLIRETQHGFTKGKSCLTNLLKFLEEVTKYVDEGNPVDVLYLDFSKAFDKVPHKRLLEKLKAHGIESNIWRWIEAWLSERRQRVVINGKASGWEDAYPRDRCSGRHYSLFISMTLMTESRRPC